MAIDRDKYRRIFIDEAREALRSFSNDLVTLEKLQASGGQGGKAGDVMDAAFRTAHSLKGMAAAMGYDRFAALAHRLEDLADVARQGKDIGAVGFDLLLEGADVLEKIVERVAVGDESDAVPADLAPRIHELVRTLQSAATGAPPQLAPPAPQPPPKAERALVVRVRIGDDQSLPQVRAFVVHKALSAQPGWLQTEPPADQLKTRELPGRTLTLRFEPSADAAAIEKIARGAQGVAEVTIGVDAPAEEAAAAAPDRPAEEDRTVRVRTGLLDELIDSVGELLLTRSRLRAIAVSRDAPELNDLVDEVDRLTKDLHARVVAARMTPLSFMTERFPRVVRDLARGAHKSVDFKMVGTDIELDRAILDELQAPFLHMLRNAVDHAHAGDDERKAAGKPAAMQLQVRALRDRDSVLLELEDDGKGIDVDKNRARAVERGLLSAADASALSDQQALELICLPGFSTVEQVSQTSGRGVGMDVVKATLERLGGSLRIASKKGQGTRFVLELPLTVAIIRVLVVEAGEGAGAAGARDAFAIPVNRVERAVDLLGDAISFAHGRAYMRHGEAVVPLFDLGQELGYGARDRPREGTVILVGRGGDVAALRVDAIVGQEEVVAKPLGAPLSTLPYLAGATLLADGRAAFILEPHRLVRG